MKTKIENTTTEKPSNPNNPYGVFEIGSSVNMPEYSDVYPGTVIAIKRNGKEIQVQEDSYKLKEGQKPNIISGEFSSRHCSNQDDLEYDITRNENGSVTTYTLRTWRGFSYWTKKGYPSNGRNQVKLGWKAFYDYNF